jgi:probable addiction module antidote protein
MPTGKTTKPAPASIPFRAAGYLRTRADIAAYLKEMLADGDARVVPIALRTVADAVGGMTALAEKTGLSREALYRTLSAKGNPRLDTLAAILTAYGLRLSVLLASKPHAQRSTAKAAQSNTAPRLIPEHRAPSPAGAVPFEGTKIRP